MSRGKAKGISYKSLSKVKKTTKIKIEGLLKIKPLSVNQCWQGKRFKTKKYKMYEHDVFDMLDKDQSITDKGNLQLYLEFGFSSIASDWDNPIKPFQDILAKMYGFNDRRIKRAVIDITMVSKGEEFIYYRLEKYNVSDRGS